MKQITINVGVELRADGLPLTERERAEGLRAMHAGIMGLFGGYTIIPVGGAWRDETGREFTEEGFQLEILADDDAGLALEHKVRTAAACVKQALQQKSVLVRVRECHAEFV